MNMSDPALPYCGTPPAPLELWGRFNLDPVLIISLLVLAMAHVVMARRNGRQGYAIAGWFVASAAFISPLCALSVALFAARIAQHTVLLLVAAPLIAFALPAPSRRHERGNLWICACAFFFALWFWHMPAPYDSTFSSTSLYWLMHVTLFGSGVLLWRALIHHRSETTAEALVAGILTSMQMGMLGAVLSLATRPLFYPHLLTTYPWGLSPLQDQALGGVIMWVPGIVLFLWISLRSLQRLWLALERPKSVA
jgi:putative membrane protein